MMEWAVALAGRERASVFYFGLHAAALSAWLLLAARRYPRLVTGVMGVAVAMNAVGWGLRWLADVPGYDKLMHCVGTLAVVLPLSISVHRREWGKTTALSLTLATLGIGLSLGVLWELYERICDQYVVLSNSMDLDDTLGDLVCDGVGSLIASWAAWRLVQKEPVLAHGEDDRSRNSGAEPRGLRQPALARDAQPGPPRH